MTGDSIYTDFLNDLAERVIQGQDPQCFGRNLNDVAEKYGFDDAQKAFCGEKKILICATHTHPY